MWPFGNSSGKESYDKNGKGVIRDCGGNKDELEKYAFRISRISGNRLEVYGSPRDITDVVSLLAEYRINKGVAG